MGPSGAGKKDGVGTKDPTDKRSIEKKPNRTKDLKLF